MFLAMHGAPSEVDLFLFVLAEKLHKTLGEVGAMPLEEIVQWRSYLHVKSTLEDLHRKAASHGL